MNSVSLAELRSLREKATQGEWTAERDFDDGIAYVVDSHGIGVVRTPVPIEGKLDAEDLLANAALIAAAVNSLPSLIAIAEAAKAYIDVLNECDHLIVGDAIGHANAARACHRTQTALREALQAVKP